MIIEKIIRLIFKMILPGKPAPGHGITLLENITIKR